MSSEITLTRKQLEHIITLIGVDGRVTAVTICQSSESGIGTHHRGTFHYKDEQDNFEYDITDVDTW